MSARLLLVEDDRVFAGILRDYLDYLGIEVQWVEDGPSALVALSEGSPDLVLTDVLLPRVDGVELAAQIRAHEGCSALPIVLMSAVYKNDAVIEADLRRCGANDYLIKPFPMAALRRLLEEHLPGACPPPSQDEGGSGLDLVPRAASESLGREGEVAPFFLAPLLLHLRAATQTGVLHMRDEARWKKIVLLNGHPIWADGGDNHDRMGTMLLEEGTISQDQFATAVAAMRDRQLDFGTALIELGILQPSELYAQLRRLVGRRVISAFSWSVGSWTLDPNLPQRASSFEIGPLVAIWRGLCTHGDVAAIRGQLGVFEEKYAIPTARFQEDWSELKTEDGIGFLGTFLSGARTVAQLRDMEIVEDAEFDRALWLMYQAGMIGFSSTPVAVRDVGGATALIPVAVDFPDDRPQLNRSFEAILRDYLRLWQADHFELMGLSEGASDAEVEEALVGNPLDWSLDELPGQMPGDIRAKAQALVARIEEAREVLGSLEGRSSYRDRLREGMTGVYRSVAAPSEAEAAMFFEQGKNHVQDRDFREAESAFSKAVVGAPDSAEYLAYQGWASYRNGGGSEEATARARGALGEALGMDPHLAIAHYFQGVIYRDQRDYQRALDCFESAVRYNPGLAPAQKALEQAADLAAIGR